MVWWRGVRGHGRGMLSCFCGKGKHGLVKVLYWSVVHKLLVRVYCPMPPNVDSWRVPRLHIQSKALTPNCVQRMRFPFDASFKPW